MHRQLGMLRTGRGDGPGCSSRRGPRRATDSGRAHTIEKDDGATYRRNAKRLSDGCGSICFDERRKRSPRVAQLALMDGKVEKRELPPMQPGPRRLTGERAVNSARGQRRRARCPPVTVQSPVAP